MKRPVLSFLIFLVLLGGGLFFYLTIQLPKPAVPVVLPASTSTSTAALPTSTSSLRPSSQPVIQKPLQAPQAVQGPRIQIGSLYIPVELARTAAETEKGLSGRPSLAADGGMLFLFSKADFYQFWMPDMHFPIDIIWMDSARKVIEISANVSNDFDPANPRLYTPPSPAQYVLEVNAGFAARQGIKIGDGAAFKNIPAAGT